MDKSMVRFAILVLGVPAAIGITTMTLSDYNKRKMLKMVLDYNAEHPERPMTIDFGRAK